MKNPDPIARAWRLEKRRKELGSDNPRCFHCPETDLPCLELDHPVTEEFDPEFKQVECRNHHRKLELQRDLAGLTKNGRHGVKESKRDKSRRFVLLHAQNLDSIAEQVLSPDGSPELIATAIQSAAASLRRKANSL